MPTSLPFANIGSVLARLDRVIAYCRARRSKLGYFAVLYRNVTVRVQAELETGRFEDPARMERLDIIFAYRYLDAFDRYVHGEPTTRSWQTAFNAAPLWSPLILQHLLLGINAHINLDLAIAAAETAPGDELPALKHDFEEISQLLVDMIDDVQVRIERVSPWFRLIDRAGGGVDEQLGALGLRGSRSRAWQEAQELARADPADWSRQIALHDTLVAGLGHGVYVPSLTLRGTHLLIRLRESDDVPLVMDILRV